jgi:hypothetical protein
VWWLAKKLPGDPYFAQHGLSQSSIECAGFHPCCLVRPVGNVSDKNINVFSWRDLQKQQKHTE